MSVEEGQPVPRQRTQVLTVRHRLFASSRDRIAATALVPADPAPFVPLAMKNSDQEIDETKVPAMAGRHCIDYLTTLTQLRAAGDKLVGGVYETASFACT